MRPAAAVLLLLALGGCASSGPERPTLEIYSKAVEVSGYGLRCSARDGIRFDRRLEPLLPWLEAELGKDEVAQVRAAMEETLGTTDFLSCPTREERVRSRIKADRLLNRLKARSKP